MSRRLIFTPISPPTTFFTYNVVGANVGAVTTSNRAALKRKANNTAKGLPCCNTGGSSLAAISLPQPHSGHLYH